MKRIGCFKFIFLTLVSPLLFQLNCPPSRAGDWEGMKDIVPEGYVCHRATGPIKIDGRPDDAAWQVAPWTKDFRDIEGDRKPRPTYRTRAKMLWDDDYFYIAAELEEPHVWGTITNHDAVIFRDNDFEVFIDPDGDSHEYYEFEMNALNTGWDLRLTKPYKDGGKAIDSWEIPGLKTAVHVKGTLNDPRDRDEGWSVEIAFPWKVLGEFSNQPAPPREGDQWRVNFSRVEWQIEIVGGAYRKVPGKPENNWVWSPQGIIDMHRPEMWAYVQFTRKAPGAVAFAPDPAFAARQTLQEIYYAQREFHTKNKRWAGSITELGLSAGLGNGFAGPPVIQLTQNGYDVTILVQLPKGKMARWHVRQDARVWPE